ncbi:hypothetical protein UlMin_031625 [Ulmus minor]
MAYRLAKSFVQYIIFVLDLYGINVRLVAPVGSASRKPYVDSALIHRILPDELLFEVFARMTPYNLGRACVCRKWRYTICNPLTGLVENYKLLQSKYEGSWRKMWVLRPRVRTDGLYVSRNTYICVGVVKWKVTNPLHTLRRKSTSGSVFTLNGGALVWRSVKQSCIYDSTMKAEYAHLVPLLAPYILVSICGTMSLMRMIGQDIIAILGVLHIPLSTSSPSST